MDHPKGPGPMKIYPNPVVEMIYLSSGTDIQAIDIYDLTGRKIHRATLSDTGTQHRLNLGSVQPGFYLVKATFVDGSEHTAKIIKN